MIPGTGERTFSILIHQLSYTVLLYCKNLLSQSIARRRGKDPRQGISAAWGSPESGRKARENAIADCIIQKQRYWSTIRILCTRYLIPEPARNGTFLSTPMRYVDTRDENGIILSNITTRRCKSFVHRLWSSSEGGYVVAMADLCSERRVAFGGQGG